MLKDELRRQRVFLSSDEEEALLRPVTYEDEDDLAYERVKGRLGWFQPALRNRFIRDGRPVALWRDYISTDEAEAGEPTLISALATRIIAWATRTSDRGAMLGTFASRALSTLGLLCALLGAYAWAHGEQAGGGVYVGVGLALLLGGNVTGRLTARRAEKLARHALSAQEKAIAGSS